MAKEFYIGADQYTTWPNMTGTNLSAAGITFNDVLIVPGDFTTPDELIAPEFNSRSLPDLSTKFGPFHLRIPIITAPMDTVSDIAMIKKMAELGGIGTLYRHPNMDEMISKCNHLYSRDIPFVASVGLKNAFEDARTLRDAGARMVLIDIANGGQVGVPLAAEQIQEQLKMPVIAGNIATRAQSRGYKKRGVIYQRVGIGPGRVCVTRLKTGIGLPQISAIMDTSIDGVFTIGDGGIQTPGDIAKALAAGAGAVMIGTMFAGTDEAPGEIIELNGNKMKRHRGQASGSYMEDHGIEIDGHRTPEGVDVLVPYKGGVEIIVNDITGGLRSEMLYVGARNLQELFEKSRFVGVSASGYQEGTPTVFQQNGVLAYQGQR